MPRADPYRYFRIEAREIVEQLGQAILALERAATAEGVSRFLRLAHTLKGASRVVKQTEIADEAHAIEGALAAFRDGSIPLPKATVEVVLRHLDDIGRRLQHLGAAPDADAATVARPPAEELLQTIRADVAEMDALLDGFVEAQARLQAVRHHATASTQARRLAGLLADQLAAPRQGGRERETPMKDQSGRVLQELRDALSTMERGLASGLTELERELNLLRGATERLRLVPASVLFPSLERTARDVAEALGTRVLFEGRGGDVRLDAHVVAVLQNALVQLVRNAVAHGIEADAERRAAGKPPEGSVTLEVARAGRRVSFTCVDDGRGVDVDAVRRALQARGLLSQEARRLDSDGLLQLLLRGGVTTSGTVTEVSGRGVGLDVVREAVERLGGEATVRSARGRGTTVVLTVPLSLASLEALVVQAGGATVSLPLDAVVQTRRVAPADVAHTPDGDTLAYEGRVIPFAPLSRVLRSGKAPERGTWSTVVVKAGQAVAAVGVDRLLGTANVVLRPLPELAPALPVVAGASLDGEGNPQLVLDPDELVNDVRAANFAALPSPPSLPPVLVIDDSLTTRMLEQSILEAAGYEVDLATSGEDALSKARARRYALFLVDVEMPGIDGFTFVEQTRLDAGLRDIPSILVTSRASAEDRRRGEEVGARAYIVKSEFDQGALLELIRGLVR